MEELNQIRIITLDRGFVFVCRCPDPERFALWLPVTHCRVIRVWGTTQGMAELCGGPLEGTILDAMAMEESFPVRAVLRVTKVSQIAWAPLLEMPKDSTTRSESPSFRTGARSRG